MVYVGQKLVEGEVAIPAASALGRRGAGHAPAGIASSPLAAPPQKSPRSGPAGRRRTPTGSAPENLFDAGGRSQTPVSASGPMCFALGLRVPAFQPATGPE